MVEPWSDISPLLNHTAWLARRALGPAAARYKITVPQAVALVALLRASAEGETLRPALLAERLGVERSVVSVVVARLVRSRWVVGSVDELDRRSHTLSLTAEGHRIASEMDEQVREIWRASMVGLPEGEPERFVKTLEHMAERLDALAVPAEVPS